MVKEREDLNARPADGMGMVLDWGMGNCRCQILSFRLKKDAQSEPDNRQYVEGYRPSQWRTPVSTKAICWADSVPSRRRSLTGGMVTGCCTRNAPSFRKGTGTGISYCEPRRAVVCGRTVYSDRSASANGALRTSTGRVFSIIPKSASQTSPRVGTAFLLVKFGEGLGRQGSQIGICHVPIIQAPSQLDDLRTDIALIRWRQSPYLPDNSFRSRCHELIISEESQSAMPFSGVSGGELTQRHQDAKNRRGEEIGDKLQIVDCRWRILKPTINGFLNLQSCAVHRA